MAKFSPIQLILIWITLSPLLALAQSYSGVGISEQLHTAKKLALSDLQQNMYVEVETLTEVTSASHLGNHYRMSSKISSSLKILGAKPQCQLVAKEHHCQITLGPSDSALYQAKIDADINEIERLWQHSQDHSGKVKLQGLEAILALFENIKPMIQVHQLLAPNQSLKTANVTPLQVQAALFELQSNPDSLAALAANIGTKYKGFERIYVRPFSLQDSFAITPFSQALQVELMDKVNAISNKDYAFYELVGHYQITQDGVQVNAQLINLTREGLSEIAAASSHQIDKKFVKRYQTAALQPKVDKVLQSDKIEHELLRVKLQTDQGNRDLLFTQGQTISLQIKSNLPVYYHLVGHSNNGKAPFSYLLDLNNQNGNEKFVQQIKSNQVNKWITIGEFVVYPPFGTESLQIFAYPSVNEHDLPEVNFEGDYYKIAGSTTEIVSKTRGLVRKSRQTPKVDEPVKVNAKAGAKAAAKIAQKDTTVAESILQFTTQAIN